MQHKITVKASTAKNS